jgi:hypothetical protein
MRADILRDLLDSLLSFEQRLRFLTESNLQSVRESRANLFDSKVQTTPLKDRPVRENGSFFVG